MYELSYINETKKKNKGNMSRRSSGTSLTTTASGSTTVEDPLMRDCYDLRRRLLQTEQSIKNLNPPLLNGSLQTVSKPSNGNMQNKLLPTLIDRQTNLYFPKPSSEPSEPAPVLTLADLSPATSDSNFEFHPSCQLAPKQPLKTSNSHDSGEKIPQQYEGDIREIDRRSFGSGDNDFGTDSLRNKLSKLREKNTSLVSQNHKLMGELENMGYDLHQERNNVKSLAVDLQKERENVQDYEDRIIALEKEISSQHVAIKSTEDKLLYTSQELQEKADEINNISQSSQDAQLMYQDESQLRQQLQSQLQETLRNVEQLTSKITQDKEYEKQQSKLRFEQLERMDRELNELTNERNEILSQNSELEGQLMELKEEIRLLQYEGVASEEYKSSLEMDNNNLRSTVARQSQRVGQLEKQSPVQNEDLTRLQDVVKLQNEKIHYYQEEIEQSKIDMLRLESLVQRVQEQSIRQRDYHNPSTVIDSGISRNTGVEDGGTMTGLRSELSFVAERNRINDRKQQELEQLISRMEDEATSYSTQLIQLEEKLAEKSAMNISLESKVNQRNLRVVDIQTDLEKITDKNSELQRQIQRKTLDIQNLETQLNEKMVGLASYASRLEEVEQSVEEKDNYMKELQENMKEKEEEVKEHRNLLEKTRSLHNEHCRELESQIEQLQKEYESKNNQVSQLDTVFKACRQDLVMKTARVQELEKSLSEQQRELQHLQQQSTECESKLRKLQEKARLEGERGIELDETLKECRQEMKVYIEQLKVTNNNHEEEMNDKISEIKQLKDVLKKCKGDYSKRCETHEKLEQKLMERNEMLKQHQKGIVDLENNETRLKQQVGILELELGQEREINKGEVNNLQCLLENARGVLEERTKQLNELNNSLVGVHKDMKQSSSHVVDLEQLLQQTREMLEKKSKEANDLSNNLKETQTKLNEHSSRNTELSTTLTMTEKHLCDKEDHVVKLDEELSKTQQEIEETLRQLQDLKCILEDNMKELKEKEEKVNELDKELNESQELLQKKSNELNEKDVRVSEMDQTIRDYKWELKQTVSEMSKLDVSMKEQRSDLKQKSNALEHSLGQYQHELSQRTLEMNELKAKYAQSQEQLKQKTMRLEYMEKTMKQQQQELRKRMDQVTEFEKEFSKLKMDSEDKTEISQELRLAREQVQNTHSELLDARRKLLQFERKEQEFLDELEEAHGLLSHKETDCTRLAKDLGSSQVREAQAEARCIQEVRRVEQQHLLKTANYENELQNVRENHSKLFSQKEEEDATHRLNIQNLREKEKVNEKELKRLKDAIATLNKHLIHSKDQLNQLQEQTFAANESIVIKESEIARLQAKVSGYERATFGSRLHFGPSDSRSSASYPKSSSPPSHSKSSYINYQSKTPVKRSNSAQDLHKLSADLVSFVAEETFNEASSRLVFPSSGIKSEDNTFERLFDQARQELDATKKTETWTSLRSATGQSENEILNRSLSEDNIQ